jgi:tRNA (guanine-N7-)-methyltransferase
VPDEFLNRFAQSSDRIDRIKKFWEQRLHDVANEEVTLEIGCGHGHWLTAFAECNPERFCIGIDLITKRVELANRKKNKRDLPRLFFFKADAVEFIRGMTPEIKLTETVLLFPDPWPKKRHHKRRLVNEYFLDLLAKHTHVGSKLYFRTDHNEFFTWTAEKINSHGSWTALPDSPWSFEHETYFQNILPKHASLIAKTT